MTIKEQLLSLYSRRTNEFKHIVETFPNVDLAGPLLMSPNKKYETQSKRLLIIGQQTNGWSYHISDVKKQMGTYEGFNLGVNYYASPFWNITRKLEKAIGIEEYSCAWTNINKFDLNSGKPYGEYEEEIRKVDDLLINEIKILNPDICVFFTGPSFDGRIKSIFDGMLFEKIENWNSRELARISHSHLPKLSFRTHHPKSLRIRHIEDRFIEFMNRI